MGLNWLNWLTDCLAVVINSCVQSVCAGRDKGRFSCSQAASRIQTENTMGSPVTTADIAYLTDGSEQSRSHQPWQILKPSVCGWTYSLTDKTSFLSTYHYYSLAYLLPLLRRPHTCPGCDLTEILTPRLIKILIKPHWHCQGATDWTKLKYK